MNRFSRWRAKDIAGIAAKAIKSGCYDFDFYGFKLWNGLWIGVFRTGRKPDPIVPQED